MSITLTQRIQEININYTEEPVALEIFYVGSFVGEVLGNTVSGMNNKKIIIVFLAPPEETLIRYYGNFKEWINLNNTTNTQVKYLMGKGFLSEYEVTEEDYNKLIDRMESLNFKIGDRIFKSRLIVGTGKYVSSEETRDAIAASGAEMVTLRCKL